ncbi:Acetolactate synthase-like protein [Fasciola hepatica]|uniref:2-hydroxyacyl-CoA lyase 2 n=1 Tax=Fasciola hepatica TaxID=6192 RepID=A0A4E0RV23_FASHE|nr:Acetolactate synthase-like protein [Fasciola hepatica]
MDYGRVLNRNAKVVIINRDKKQLYLNSDIFWRPYLAIRGDVGTTLKELATNLNDRFPCMSDFRCPTDWVSELLAREHHRDEEIRQNSLAQPGQRINPLTVLWLLEHNGLNDEEENIIVADGGDFVGSAAYILRPRGPLSWLDPGPFGTLGVGGGFALGAKLCRPQANVWVIYGDGSSAYSLAEWDTMARHKAPAIGVIGNDACWSQIARDQLGLFGSNVACSLRSTKYELVGAAYAGANLTNDPCKSNSDCGAFSVTEKNVNNFTDYLTQARELSFKGLPSIINCHIAASGFRDGSISL